MQSVEVSGTEDGEKDREPQWIAFLGARRIASGPRGAVALKAKAAFDRGPEEPLLIFDLNSSRTVEIDFRGTPADVERRLSQDQEAAPSVERRGPGRPRLGVVGREVTLLPRHWDWLDEQPGGASVALRKLVETARRDLREKDQARASQDSAYRFMSVMAGNCPGFEEAARALFAGQAEQLVQETKRWPKDIREHARKLAAAAFHDREQAESARLRSLL